MHVLISAQYFWPESVGAGVWIHQLASDLAERGHRVTMLTTFPNYPHGKVFVGYRGRFFSREKLGSVEVVRTYICATSPKSFWPRAISYGSFCLSALLGAVAADRPDVIYAILPPLPLGMSMTTVGAFKKVPVVVNIQDIYPDIAVSLGYLKNRTAIKFFQAIEKAIYRSSEAIVVIAESFKQNLSQKGVPPVKIRVIPNWADAESIKPGPKANSFREKLDVDGRFLVVYSGGMGHNTALSSVIEAASFLDNEPFHFALVGDGFFRRELEEQAERRKLRNVSFLPFQLSEVYPQVLAASDLQLVTLNASASQSSLPSKVLKIMASGRPVVALARPESDLARLLNDAHCGVVVNPDDSKGLANTLKKLSAMPEELESMGKNARRYFAQHFDRHLCVSKIETVLREAAGG